MRCGRLIGTALLLPLATSAAASELELRFRDEDGGQAEVERVEVLVWAWGEERRFVHEAHDGIVTVPLGYAWLEDAWPERARDVWTARLVIQAGGYVPVVSREFHWLGTQIPPQGRIGMARIDFDGRQRRAIAEGEQVAFDLILRRPRERWLRLVDEAGRPLAGVELRVSAYGATQNHCGLHQPALDLGAATSDPEGRLPFPDGDFEYAFELDAPYVVVSEPSHDLFPQRLFTALAPTSENVLRLHPFEKRRLQIHVTWQGAGVAGASLAGCLSSCPCGACCGELARADASGRIEIEAFHPERFDVIFFAGQNGARIWHVDPSKLERDLIDVDLTAASPEGPPYSQVPQ